MSEPQSDFAAQFCAVTGHPPFPWQTELFARFTNGIIDRSLDIPTGLGKTAVMAVWLLARAHGAAVPRRLVYVVDRRAVVDQATQVATDLRLAVDRNPELRRALGLDDGSLPISTLRGQYIDNREWLEDPSTPAIIVGTVDMIGSRLLFEGYGTSRKMRPYHAGLLGADVLAVLDEAHLVPPFEKLLEVIADGSSTFGPREKADRELVPPFRLLSLSATGRAHSGRSLVLQDADLGHPDVRRRLDAPKRLTVHPPTEQALEDALAEQAWRLTSGGQHPLRIVVFCDKREVARKAKAAVEKLAKGDKAHSIPEILVDTELFVGGRRVFERQAAAERLEKLGFIAGKTSERLRPAFLFATSAAEVGVDLDADHMVSDLVAWERMVQRLGRVNRRGDGKAEVVVVEELPSKELESGRRKTPDDRSVKETAAVADAERARAVRQLFDRLPRKDGAPDASPGALRLLKLSAAEDADVARLLGDGTTPAPLKPVLSRALIDAWSMTSLDEHPGRPEIGPWLRGWVDETPQTSVVWRRYLPVRTTGAATKNEVQGFFEAAEPHVSEVLETETFHIVDWLSTRVRKLKQTPANKDEQGGRMPVRGSDIVAILLTPSGDLRQRVRLDDLDFDSSKDPKHQKERKAIVERALKGATLVLDARIGGLSTDGLLNGESEHLPRTSDDDGAPWPGVAFRVRRVEAAEANGIEEKAKDWKESFRLVIDTSENGDARAWLVVENATSEERRSTGPPQTVDEHQVWAERRARRLATNLCLPEPCAEMLAVAASLHDEGKRNKRWQRAFNAAKDGLAYAKTRGPVNTALLDGYRHEFGSLPTAALHPRLTALSEELQDLSLHAIAAHHGFARPIIRTDGCDDAPPSALEERAYEVALRFSRLQRRWGPWGLAWWEALMRAADQQASRENETTKRTPVKGSN